MPKLKACPCCGGDAHLRNNEIGRGVYDPETFALVDSYSAEADTFWVECEECFTMSGGYATEEEAIEAWNRRVDDGKDDI